MFFKFVHQCLFLYLLFYNFLSRYFMFHLYFVAAINVWILINKRNKIS